MNLADMAPGTPDAAGAGPVVTQVAPTTGVNTGGTALILSGSGFASGATVKLILGANTVVPANPTVSPDGMSITFQAPANTGKPGVYDVVVTNPDSATAMQAKAFTYFLGTVSFAAGTTITGDVMDRGPRSVVAADMDKDGNLDLVVAYANSNTVAVLLGDGKGKFTPKTTNVGVGTYPYSVTVGDVNGDGKADALVANADTNNVSVLLGKGDGSFDVKTAVSVGPGPNSVVSADLDGDGKLDLATANYTPDSISTFLGGGDGSFKSLAMTTVGAGVFALHAPDLNADGKPDLALVARTTGKLQVLLNSSQ